MNITITLSTEKVYTVNVIKIYILQLTVFKLMLSYKHYLCKLKQLGKFC